MAQGIIQVSPSAVQDFIDLTVDLALIDLGKLKDVLLLPERYTVEQVRHNEFSILNGYVEVVVSCSDIPEVTQGETLPSVTPWFSCEFNEDYKTRTIFLSDIKIDGVSAIQEDDKDRKVTMEIKEVRDAHADARDTQFQGFAKLLMDGLLPYFGDFEDMERIIAQHAYGLVEHTLKHAPLTEYEAKAEDVPDFTEWPKEEA